MKRFKVEITEEALNDMEDIYDYIAVDLQSPENAIGQYDRIANAILSLDVFPEKFRVFMEKEDSEIRRMVVDHYSVFYVILDEKVVVTNVLYSAVNLEEKIRGN
ncbi:MAG: type II toxin-antitoxin system RelE/ParE family toxin [Lachnospiraceae bacterium]|nr:type II toxin-antitoxin system RelE/ParE family toxin [Lachnospiraceae bacterium]